MKDLMPRLLLSALCALTLSLPGFAHALEWDLEAGLGYDSNAFRTPEDPYEDPPGGGTFVTPDVQSGLFLPLGLKAVTSSGPRGTELSYRFKGEFYLDSALDNANNYRHDVRFGKEWESDGGKGRGGTRYLGARLTRHREIYVDRDDGDVKTTGGVDISDRDTYTGFALEGEIHQSAGPLRYGLDGRLQVRDYDDPGGGVTQNDRNVYEAEGYTLVRISGATRLKLSAGYRLKDYDERESRDLSGAKVSTPREYAYITYRAAVSQELGPFWTATLSFRIRELSDQYVGYEDYTEQRIKLVLVLDKGTYQVEAGGSYKTRDYPNTLAFDDPAGGALDYDATRFDLRWEQSRTEVRTVFAEAGWKRVDTNDSRYAYDRLRLVAGMAWAF